MPGKDPLQLNKLVQDKVIEKEYTRRDNPFNQFSPSMVGYCKRQMYNRKMNLTQMPRKIQGILHAGTVNHYWLEHHLPSLVDDRAIQTEQRVKTRIPTPEDFDLYVSGYADAVDSEGYVYDHKFTGSTYYVEDEPKPKDARQVMMYLYSLDHVEQGQLEYVTRNGDFEKDNFIIHTVEFDQDEFVDMVDNMTEVAEKVREHDRQGREHINPFDKCGCFFCESEEFKPRILEKQMDDPDYDHTTDKKGGN